MTTFIIILIIFIPQLIILIDFLIKSIYIYYWNSIFRNRFYIFTDELNIGNNSFTIRRKSIDDYFIIKLDNGILLNRPYEYACDKNGTITILGTSIKKTKILFGYYIQTQISFKIPDFLKSKYLNLLKNKPNIDTIIFKRNNITNLEPNNLKINERELKLKLLVLKTYKERKKEFKYGIINLDKLTDECINIFRKNDIITKDEINELITDKLHEHALLN